MTRNLAITIIALLSAAALLTGCDSNPLNEHNDRIEELERRGFEEVVHDDGLRYNASWGDCRFRFVHDREGWIVTVKTPQSEELTIDDPDSASLAQYDELSYCLENGAHEDDQTDNQGDDPDDEQ